MSIQESLQIEIEDSKDGLSAHKKDSTYKRDLCKRIDLINWDLDRMKDPSIPICEIIE